MKSGGMKSGGMKSTHGPRQVSKQALTRSTPRTTKVHGERQNGASRDAIFGGMRHETGAKSGLQG
jgi:hypothetical protein